MERARLQAPVGASKRSVVIVEIEEVDLVARATACVTMLHRYGAPNSGGFGYSGIITDCMRRLSTSKADVYIQATDRDVTTAVCRQ